MAGFYYFPRPYPNELIGSLILRACQHRATSFKRTAAQITGSTKSYLPLSMSSWLPQIARATGTDMEELLWMHTAFPYVTRFMSLTETNRLAADLLDDKTPGNAALTHSGLQGSPGHRFCLTCLQEDEAKFGEVYWHREHNLPMVGRCLRHDCLLQVERPMAKRPTPSNFAVNHLPTKQTSALFELAIPKNIAREIGVISEECLTARDRTNPTEWYSNYRFQLRAKGFPLQGAGLASLVFAKAFEIAFGKTFLQQVKLAFNPKSRPWPILMLRERTSTPFITPKHVLICTYISLFDLFERPLVEDALYLPSGRVPQDYKLLDEGYVVKIQKFIDKAKENGARIEVTQMLTELGIWATYRHSREKLPETKALLSAFRKTEYSARQIGRRARISPTALKIVTNEK